MKLCIRCNPVSELVDTPDGLQCRLHGYGYVLEERAYPEPAVEVPADAVSDVAVDGAALDQSA